MAIWSRDKFFKLSKGYWGRSKNCWRISMRRVFKALQYTYRDRKVRRREVKKGWIRTQRQLFKIRLWVESFKYNT